MYQTDGFRATERGRLASRFELRHVETIRELYAYSSYVEEVYVRLFTYVEEVYVRLATRLRIWVRKAVTNLKKRRVRVAQVLGKRKRY